MEITRLPPGTMAPDDSDCINICSTEDGRFELITSALVECEDETEGDSEAVIKSDHYDSYDSAERAGLTWAEERCVSHLYIETDA